MEKYREKLKNRITICFIYCVIMIVPNIMLYLSLGGTNFTWVIQVIMVVIQAVSIGLMTVYGNALKNDEQLKKLYIRETDERLKFINTKVATTSFYITVCSLSFVMIISGYFNKIIFFTLLSVLVFILITICLSKFIYNKKI